MTDDEFAAFRNRLVAGYAEDIARADAMSADAARAEAARQTDELLADGARTDGQLLFTAVDETGQPVGVLWLATRTPRGQTAGWIYDIEVHESHRGKGYGRELMLLAEQECRKAGLASIRLNVFGPNVVARRLYESLGYEITSQNMAKQLD